MTPMEPFPYRVVRSRAETADTVTLELEPVGAAISRPDPGQFTMMYAFGIGEVPISVSRTGPALEQTVRSVGAVTKAVCASRPGQVLGLRGPFGVGWGLDEARGHDLLLAAGGIGLAPLRPVLLEALAERDAFGRIALLIGTRTPDDLLYAGELDAWRDLGVQVEVTVDRPGAGWSGHVGLITGLTAAARIDPASTMAFVCGPEIMMRFMARALADRGVPGAGIRLSMERNMRCGLGWCGHCQLGPLLICRDGPVMPYERALPLMTVKEL